jgi:hypothetical protein
MSALRRDLGRAVRDRSVDHQVAERSRAAHEGVTLQLLRLREAKVVRAGRGDAAVEHARLALPAVAARAAVGHAEPRAQRRFEDRLRAFHGKFPPAGSELHAKSHAPILVGTGCASACRVGRWLPRRVAALTPLMGG